MEYETMLINADQQDVIVKEKDLCSCDGLISGNRIAIRKTIQTQTEKSCVLAEELGHHFTSSGNILDLTDEMAQKQEYRARLFGYNLKVGLAGLISAYNAGCCNRFEIAEYLDVTELYLNEVISCYTQKYGTFTNVDNYIIYFTPNLGVLKISNSF